jgi:ribosomal protein S18 acetylase RimI-like enzyme
LNREVKIRGNVYTIKPLSKEEFFPLLEKHSDSIFSQDHSLHFRDFLSEAENKKINELGKDCYDQPFSMNLAVFDKKENFIGWSFGWQENPNTYYMCNSAVLPKYRRKGIYSALLDLNIEILKEKGFQLIYSRHNATNNNVIIPKLKKDFIISKMEISDTFGCLVHLHYYTNKTRRKIMDYRCGEKAPDDELKKLFNM